jgi:hypothetical protein
MVNVFQRLTRRATGSNLPESGTSGPGQDPNIPSNPHVLHRRNSTASIKRSRRHDYEAEEPVPRRLILISDTPEFDPEIIRRFRAEAFDVEYLPFTCTGDAEKDRKTLENKVHMREDDLETGERYAIVGKLHKNLLKPELEYVCPSLIDGGNAQVIGFIYQGLS